MQKILIAFGTRPEAIKLFPVIHALQGDGRFTVVTCGTGQHRELLDPVLAFARVQVDHDLKLMRPGQGLDALVADIVVNVGRVIAAVRPDWIIVQGDTATAFASTVAGHHHQVRVAHVEAGLRSGSISHPWPEEGYRRSIAPLATLHFAPTSTAADSLKAEGVRDEQIVLTGNTVIDALHFAAGRIDREPGLTAEASRILEQHKGRRIIVVTTHRRENHGAPRADIAKALAALSERDDVAFVIPLHPSDAARPTALTELSRRSNVSLCDPLSYPDFAALLRASHIVLSDSGGVQEEAPTFGVPVLVLRETTERPEGVAAGTSRLVGTNPDRIVVEVSRLLDDPAAYAAMARAHSPFGDGRASERIVDRLALEAVKLAIPAHEIGHADVDRSRWSEAEIA